MPSLLDSLLEQMAVGFNRRDEEFLTNTFNAKKCGEGIAKSSLVGVLGDLGVHVRPNDETELFYAHDLNNDGCMDSDEFLSIVKTAGKVEQWASSLPLAQLLSDCIPWKTDEADPVRGVSLLSEKEIQAISECYRQGLEKLLDKEVKRLNLAYQEMDKIANNAKAANADQASSKFGISMSCGGIDNFQGGLSDRIGDANLDFEKAMKDEHCHQKDSKTSFTTSNYQVETCAHKEWHIVVHGDISKADTRHDRRIRRIEELVELPIAASAKLSRAEVIAVVLYTGPMYEKYNCALRRWPAETYKDMTMTAQVSNGGSFTTTIHVLASAVQKLASVMKIPDGLKLYRGLGRVSELPECFYKAHGNGGRGFTEWGFMSTTSDKQVAISYSTPKEGEATQSVPMVLELTVGAVDRGACIKDLSQYPQEVEYLWVPCSFVAPAGPETMQVTPYGVVRIVPVRVNSNLTTRTIEHILGYKKHTHLSAFCYALHELQHHLSDTCNEKGTHRLEKDFLRNINGTIYTCEGFVEIIMGKCERIFEAHEKTDASTYANDGAFRRLVTEMLDIKTMAKSMLTLWLQDPSQCIVFLKDMSLHDAHRRFVWFLKNRMVCEDKIARSQSALEICRLKGLVDESVDEVNDMELGETKLDTACCDGVNASDLELLIEAGGLMDAGDEQECKLSVALMKSAEFGHTHCIQTLVKAKANVGFKDEGGVTPLCIASHHGRAEAVRMLFESKADVNAANTGGVTPLTLASQNGHFEAVRILLEAKADVNAACKDGATPLYMASQIGHDEAVRTLLEAKADIKAASTDGDTPLHIASHNGHDEAVRMLLEAKADVNDARADGITSLGVASLNGHAETVSMLLEAKADVNAATTDGVTPLYCASQNGHVDAARMLLDAKADVNAANTDGVSPLQLSSMYGYVETDMVLLEAKADVNAVGMYGVTPLYSASQDEHVEVVRMLLEAKADVNAETDGLTALDAASCFEHTEVMRMLLEAKANLKTGSKMAVER